MLVLERKLHDKIFIGDNIVVEVVEIRPHLVRLGITAPKEVEIERDDVKKHRPKVSRHSIYVTVRDGIAVDEESGSRLPDLDRFEDGQYILFIECEKTRHTEPGSEKDRFNVHRILSAYIVNMTSTFSELFDIEAAARIFITIGNNKC